MRPAEQSRSAIAMILGASGFLLLIACANVGNLLLALSVARQRDIAVRRALGASRGRIIRQAMIEGFLLSGLGALGGLWLTMWGGVAAAAVIPARLGLFAVHPLEVDGRVIGFAVLLALVTGLLATLISADRRAGPDIAELQGRSATSTPSHGGLRSVVLGAQVALTLALLIGAGLFAVSLADLVRVEPGFAANGLGYVEMILPERRYPTSAGRDRFFEDLVVRVARIPGVRDAAQGMPPSSGMYGRLIAESSEQRPGAIESLRPTYVGPGYFRLTGVKIRAYLPYSQDDSPAWRTVLFRKERGHDGVFDAIRSTITSMDADLAVSKYGIVTDLYDDLYASPRFFASLMSLFAVVALVTAGIGLGASLMYTVSRRTREIGVRMALGADARNVRRLVLRDALGAVVAGAAVGLVATFWLGRLVESMLFGISSRNPVAIASATAALLVTAVVAAYLPARRATQVDPMIALRAE